MEQSNTSRNRYSLASLGCVIAPISIMISIIVCGSIVTGSFSNFFNGLAGGIRDFFVPDPDKVTIMSSREILSGIQTQSELVSFSAGFANANITVKVDRTGVANINCGYSASYVAEGTIKAGIDLGEIAEEDIVYYEVEDHYTLTAPNAHLASCSLDYIDQYRESFTLCPGVEYDELRQIAGYTALQDFQSEALEGGILSRAQEQAGLVLKNLIGYATKKDVEVIFNESNTSPLVDSTCSPITPMDWEFDEDNETWTKII